jgi:transposase
MSTPPRRQVSKHWETLTRTQVLTLLEKGYSQRQISCRTGVPRSTIARWNKDRNPMRRNHFRTGRPKKLTKHDIRRLIGILQSGCEGRKLSWGKLAKKASLHVSSKTIKRALNLEGYHQCRASKKPFINRETQHARKVYAMIHLHKPIEFWRSHVFG